MPQRRLGEILLARRLITARELDECLIEQARTKEFFGAVLVRKGIIREKDLMEALAEQSGLPLVNLREVYIDWDLGLTYVTHVLSHRTFLPIRQDDLSVTVAISNPMDVASVSSVEMYVRPKRLKMVLTNPSDLKASIDECEKRHKAKMKSFFDK